jgi:hypothetical protein
LDVHQAEARRGVLVALVPAGDVRAGGAPRVDEELVHVLKGVEAVRAARAQDVNVEAVRLGEEQVGLVGDECEALEEADADAAVGHDLGEREGGGLDIVAALDDLEVRRNRAQVLVSGLVGEVAQAQRLANLARRKQLLEL